MGEKNSQSEIEQAVKFDSNLQEFLGDPESRLVEIEESGEVGPVLRRMFLKRREKLNSLAEEKGLKERDFKALETLTIVAWREIMGDEGKILEDKLESPELVAQEKLSMLCRENILFNKEGKQVNLQEYLQISYQDLIKKGYELNIEEGTWEDATSCFSAENLSQIDRDLTSLIGKQIDSGKNFSVPLLMIKHPNGKQANVPFIYGWFPGKKARGGYYSLIDSSQRPREQVLLITHPTVKYGVEKTKLSIPNLFETIIHEIDHAILDQVRSGEVREAGSEIAKSLARQREIKDKYKDVSEDEIPGEDFTEIIELQLEIMQMQNYIREIKNKRRLGDLALTEGLAEQAASNFRGLQARKMAKSISSEKLSDSDIFEALTLYDPARKLGDQAGVARFPYGLGEMILSAAKVKDSRKWYVEEKMVDMFLDNPESVKIFLMEMIANAKENMHTLGLEVQDPEDFFKELLVRFAGPIAEGEDLIQLFYGEEYKREIDNLTEEQLDLTEEQAKEKLTGLLNKWPSYKKQLEREGEGYVGVYGAIRAEQIENEFIKKLKQEIIDTYEEGTA